MMDGVRDGRKHSGQKLQYSTPWRLTKNLKIKKSVRER